jgi:serine/threonine protein kinase/Tol biopolymer transport system component
MTVGRWPAVERLYHEALTRPEESRAAFLADVCGDDSELRSEVESLLAQEAGAVGFLSTPAVIGGAVAGTSLVGQQLGPYVVQTLLGSGGMGEVYRARDTTLGRDVAIKVLPSQWLADSERLARFEREARVLATLNHPHIGAIYGTEAVDGGRALVLELVEGPTLQESLVRPGRSKGRPLPGPDGEGVRTEIGSGRSSDRPRGRALSLREALTVSRQIADALEAAHEKGIVHRDLKPANIKITPEGVVKVLDFGLAKLGAGGAGEARGAGEAGGAGGDVAQGFSPADLTNSPTFTRGTKEGVILGTAAYMSPEQARGQVVDKRTDIWAFGCVLYEMLTGTAPFGGATVTDTLAAIIEREPDWRALPETTPATIRRLLRRCLEKDPKRRLHDIADARIEVDDAVVAPTGEGAGAGQRSTPRRAWLTVTLLTAAVAILAAAIAALRRPQAPSQAGPERRFEIVIPPTIGPWPVISPDGEKLVYLATSEGEPKLWLHSLVSGSARLLAGTGSALYPFWSPDSRAVAFLVPDSQSRTPGQLQLKRIDIGSGAIETLTTAQGGSAGSWNNEGVILFQSGFRGPIARIAATGGQPSPVTSEALIIPSSPSFLPDGRRFLFEVKNNDPNSRGIYIGSLDGSEPRRLLDAENFAYHPPSGQLLFVRRGILFAQPLDADRLQPVGTPYQVADRVGGRVSISDDGSIAYRVGRGFGTRQFAWFDRSGRRLANVGEPFDGGFSPSMSPDGRRVAMYRRIEGDWDIWLLSVERGVVSRFTLDAGDQVNPIWSPDGRRIVYLWRSTGASQLYQKPADAAGNEEPLLVTDQDKSPSDWSPDGRFVLYQNTDPKTGEDLWALPLEGDRKPFPVVQTTFQEQDGQFSPDGRWLAYQSNQSGRVEIYVQRFPEPDAPTQVSLSGGSQVRWRRDGRELFYVAPDNKLMAVPVRASREGQIDFGTPVALFSTGSGTTYIVSPDGQRILLNVVQAGETPVSIAIILNWKPKQ